jgi:hypothetical protein
VAYWPIQCQWNKWLCVYSNLLLLSMKAQRNESQCENERNEEKAANVSASNKWKKKKWKSKTSLVVVISY